MAIVMVERKAEGTEVQLQTKLEKTSMNLEQTVCYSLDLMQTPSLPKYCRP